MEENRECPFCHRELVKEGNWLGCPNYMCYYERKITEE